uniref:NADH-ubiquinone oxidoreductase chain 4L n=1 Tax=Dermacentor steini TaxID=859978 RepID=A0A976MZ16_9ACAR|nr:NADH dehydrogenase subunit 4L [Dermacentor steini]UNO54128.1 NADH dehydrogenase subunit 4L [Dermacentor steini]UNO54141.1 NADH dehydrogenase subunit 4L [Dermacentor steini]UNO54167.1 NADH dehydrogenase subunit 4L [Dermacentor steini]WPQ69982.1 nad4L [Dermacentor steini]
MLISILVMYLIGLFSFLINRHFMMMILLSIEFMYMSLLLMMCIYFSFSNILSIFIFLITVVCEAALGMSLLVLMSFYYGNEMMKSFSLIKC